MSDNLKTIGSENIPKKYQELAERKILSNNDNKLGKIKYNDKVLHQSKLISYFSKEFCREGIPQISSKCPSDLPKSFPCRFSLI